MSSFSHSSAPRLYRGQFSSCKSRRSSSSPDDETSKILEASDDEGDSSDDSQDESQRLMGNDDEAGNIQIEVPAHLIQMAQAQRGSGSSARPRMGRRFTLNPLIFAKVRKIFFMEKGLI